MAMVTVTGGTGVLGRALVPLMQADGHQVTVLTRRAAAHVPSGARRAGGDLASGDGLDAAVGEAEVIVHLATHPFRPARVDVRGTSTLIEAARRRGSGPHLVYVSIVGVDRIPWPYFKRKRQAEVLVSGSGLPFTIQRATQFHDLVLMAMASAARMPVLVIPARTGCQPVDVTDVAERLAQIVRSGPVDGFGADLGGPQILDAAELARDVVSALGARRPVRPVRVPGRVGAGFRAGHHLAASTPRGTRTWTSYLRDRCSAEPGVLQLPYTGRRVPVRRHEGLRDGRAPDPASSRPPRARSRLAPLGEARVSGSVRVVRERTASGTSCAPTRLDTLLMAGCSLVIMGLPLQACWREGRPAGFPSPRPGQCGP